MTYSKVAIAAISIGLMACYSSSVVPSIGISEFSINKVSRQSIDSIIIHKPVIAWFPGKYSYRLNDKVINKMVKIYLHEIESQLISKVTKLDSADYDSMAAEVKFIHLINTLSQKPSASNWKYHLFVRVEHESFFRLNAKYKPHDFDQTSLRILFVNSKTKEYEFLKTVSMTNLDFLRYYPTEKRIKEQVQTAFK